MKALRVVERVRFNPKASVPPGLLDGRSLSRPWIVTDEFFASEAPEMARGGETDELVIAWIYGGTANERDVLKRSWWTAPETGLLVRFEHDNVIVEWTSGRAVVSSPADCKAELLAGLSDFDFLERGLRRLETALAACESDAEEDISRAYQIRFRDRSRWKQIAAKIETATELRLAFVRLRPALEVGACGLPPRGKRLAQKLRTRAQIEYRLDGFCERLEACEELYEGAHDRISDYRWYVGGHFLEITIIVLLAVEALLMWLDLSARH